MQCRSCHSEIRFAESVENGICSRCRGLSIRNRGAYGLGAGLLLLGVRMFFLHPATGLVLIGCGLVAVLVPFGVGSVARALNQKSTPDDDPDAVQIAGKLCGVCEKKILSVLDGATCDRCAAACHEDCLGKHMTSTHDGARTHPYRR